jgi:hypothetical protein
VAHREELSHVQARPADPPDPPLQTQIHRRHLPIVFGVAVSHWLEHQTGWAIKKFVLTARRYAPSASKPADKS